MASLRNQCARTCPTWSGQDMEGGKAGDAYQRSFRKGRLCSTGVGWHNLWLQPNKIFEQFWLIVALVCVNQEKLRMSKNFLLFHSIYVIRFFEIHDKLVAPAPNLQRNFSDQKWPPPRHDICHMHHMQRMCKVISPRVKFYILKALFEQYEGIILVFSNIQSCKPMI